MARFGIEAVRNYPQARNAGIGYGDSIYTFDRSNGFAGQLRSAGHTQTFYWTNANCWPTDILPRVFAGEDYIWADTVDVLWIETRSSPNDYGNGGFRFDTSRPIVGRLAGVSELRLGDDFNNEWVMAYTSDTFDPAQPGPMFLPFEGMHIFCTSWGTVWDGVTTADCGKDVGQNLINGDTVSTAWHNGLSDWWVDNHAVTVCVGDDATWNNGNIRWERSYLDRDHLWGHGPVAPDLGRDLRACLLWILTEA